MISDNRCYYCIKSETDTIWGLPADTDSNPVRSEIYDCYSI